MSRTAPSDRDISSGDDHRTDDATAETRGRDWKQAVATVTYTVADAAVDAVAIVGDAARSLTPKQRADSDRSAVSAPRPGPGRIRQKRRAAAAERSARAAAAQRSTKDRAAGKDAEKRSAASRTNGKPTAATPVRANGKAPATDRAAGAAPAAGKARSSAAAGTDDVRSPKPARSAKPKPRPPANGRADTTSTARIERPTARARSATPPPTANGNSQANAETPANGRADTTSTARIERPTTRARSATPPPTANGKTSANGKANGTPTARTTVPTANRKTAVADSTSGTSTARTERPPAAGEPSGRSRTPKTENLPSSNGTGAATATAAAMPVPAAAPATAPQPSDGARRTVAWLPPLRRRTQRERPWVLRAAAFAAISVAGLAAIVVAAVALLPRAAAFATDSADAELVLPQDTVFDPLASRSRVLYGDGSLLAILHGVEDRKPVRLDKMPDHAWQAIVAAEDQKFFEHEGYDPAGIGRALVANFQAGGVEQGGSTISQQVARMNFKEVGLERSVERKVKEVAYAIALEERFSKEDLLDRYVNQVYFGSGAYGLQAASEEFFDKGVVKITPDQAALLAGLISSPSAYNPRVDPELAKQQRDSVLASMAEVGYLTDAEAEEFASKPIKIAKPSKGTNKQPSVLEEIMREFTANPLFGATFQEREDLLFNGGLRIKTTIRPKLQRLAQKTVENNFSNDGRTAAIGVVDPRNGQIKAAASSKKLNRKNFNLALRGRRQPGSAFKPFVMAAALKAGFSPATTLAGRSPIVFPQKYGEPWAVSNYGGASYGDVDMARATKSSINTYYAQLIKLVGVEKSVKMAEELGIAREGIGEKGFYGPAIVLGGLRNGATPVEMASAYGTFANNGVHVEPFLIAKVKRGKTELLNREPQKKQVLKPSVNAAALRMLEGPPSAGGTAPIAALPGWPVAGKTGTTQQATDAWFVGTTPVLATAVWVGHPKGQVRMYGATGGGTAAPIWKQFMSEALSGRKTRNFPKANEAEFVGKTVKVPNIIGKSEQVALSKLAKRKLIGRAQLQASAAPAGSVLWASPSDKAQIGTTVYVGVSTGVPPPPPKPDKPSSSGGGDDDDDEKQNKKKRNRGRGGGGDDD